MGLLDKLRSWGRQGYIVEYRPGASVSVLGYSVERLYREQPALRAVVSFLADNVSSLPIKVYDRADDTDRRRLTDGPAYGVLMRPNASTTAHDMTLGTVTDYLLYGWALWYVYRSLDAAQGFEAMRIPVTWVQDTLTEDGLTPSGYVVQNPDSNRAPVTLPASSCVRFVSYDPLGQLHPHSPVESLRQTLSEQISAWEFRNGIWHNGGRVQQWISRPLDAKWEPGARDRFAQSWRERYSGNEGTNMGGTPLLEDGMRLETTQFNAREAQWQEVTRLAREDVAAVYHVNPSLIWHTDGQTYASAKDNARALYADTLAPLLNMYEGIINGVLLPMVGESPSVYVEFDLEAKLAGSFEERASVMQSAVGGPWMTRNEARAKLNMPAIDGADELIVPLNVVEGGLASPNDTDPTKADERQTKAESPDGEWSEVKVRTETNADEVDGLASVVAKFVRRQAKRVMQDIEREGEKARSYVVDLDNPPAWWNGERWDREFAEDLLPEFERICDRHGVASMLHMGEEGSLFRLDKTNSYLKAMAESYAGRYNRDTLTLVGNTLGGVDANGDPIVSDLPMGEQVANVFETRADEDAKRAANAYANSVASFATEEAARQLYPQDTPYVTRTKTWVHHPSKHPRPEHEAMDGETVPLDAKFSDGHMRPSGRLNCHCTIDVSVRKRRKP